MSNHPQNKKPVHKKNSLRKFIYVLKNKYFTLNNIVIVVAIFITASWVWGSLQVMQRNFGLQKELDQKARLLELTQLQKENLELQGKYFQTDEYKELAARDILGLVKPGESLVVLPANSQKVIDADNKAGDRNEVLAPEQTSNIEQWINFLFGGYSKHLNK